MAQRTFVYQLLLVVLLGTSCSKDEQEPNDFDNGKINLVIADNFNLSAFHTALKRSRIDLELQSGSGPYTTLAPSDAAFAKAGYNGSAGVLTADLTSVSRIANYHTLDGKYELDRLPFVFNQELRSRGGKLYATHWIKGSDTVLTINGAKVIAMNIPASNGVIQVLDRVLTPYLHNVLSDAVAAESSITIFAQALKTSGLLQTIGGNGTYTIFAPDNAAMRTMGYSSVDAVAKMDPAVLKAQMSYHILSDRRFVFDYILSAGPANTSRQAMLDGNSITVRLSADPDLQGSFNGITLRGIGNTADVKLVKQDILTGNGVLHIIDACLRIVQ